MSIIFSGAAIGDLDSIEDHFRRTAGEQLVQLFQKRLAHSLSLFEQFPFSAPEFEPPITQLPDMRYFPIRMFSSYAVYYQPINDGIRVVRVLHTSRNVSVVFNPAPDSPV